MWLSFGIRPAKNEHKRLLILKIQSPLVTAFGLSFFLSPKVGNSFQTAKHHSKNLHITSQKAFTTKLSFKGVFFIKSTDCTHKDEKEISFEKASDRLIMKIKQRQEKIKEIQKRIENL